MPTQNKQPKSDFESALRRGDFRNRYLIYCRKSTDEADNQKNSINYQSKENARFADRAGLPVAQLTISGFCTDGVISEKHSGFKETDDLLIKSDGTVQYQIDRPKFQQLLKILNEGHIRGVICLCWDRLSRNRGDDTIIRKLMRRGVDVRFVFASYDQSSAGELHMDIDGMFAQHHSRVTSEKVRLATRLKRGEGKCTYRAPIGYLNAGSMDHKPQDPERAPIIKDLFELCATGDWSIPDLTRYAKNQGLTGVPSRSPRSKVEMLADDGEDFKDRPKVSRPVRENRIHQILRNPFYAGKLIGPEGAYIPSTSHDPLVDLETFDRVQAVLTRKRVSIYHEKKAHRYFRGFVRCAQCRRCFTPYVKKGITYYSSRCVAECPNQRRNCNLEFIDRTIQAQLAALVPSEAELEMLDAQAGTEIALLEERRHREEARRERKRTTIREELAYLRTNQLALLRSGVYAPDTLAEERERLEQKLDKLADEEGISEGAMRALVKDVLKVSELLNNLTGLYQNATATEKEQIVKKISSELLIDENTAQLSPAIGLEPVFRLKILTCEPKSWFSELLPQAAEIKYEMNALRRHVGVIARTQRKHAQSEPEILL